MSKKIGVIVFPGSNCDHDTYHAMKHVMNADKKFLGHKEEEIDDIDLILVPGGLSYGDYLRYISIDSICPVMNDVHEITTKISKILVLCNSTPIFLGDALIHGE